MNSTSSHNSLDAQPPHGFKMLVLSWSAFKRYFTFFCFVMREHFFSLLMTRDWDIRVSEGNALKGNEEP